MATVYAQSNFHLHEALLKLECLSKVRASICRGDPHRNDRGIKPLLHQLQTADGPRYAITDRIYSHKMLTLKRVSYSSKVEQASSLLPS